MRHLYKLVLLVTVLVVALSACGPTPTPAPTAITEATAAPDATEAPTEEATAAPADSGFTFGLLMVGPYNDHGWSQAHYEAGLYVEKNIPGAKMLYVDKVNPVDHPGTTPAQLAEDLVSK